MKYSQNDEQQVIEGFFEQARIPAGRFIDIGAYNGKDFSNTYRLVELGWGGVCIEPSPSVLPDLIKLHADNPKIEIVNAAVGKHASLVEFYDSSGDAISTTSPEHMEKWSKGWKVSFKKFLVYTVPLSEIFGHYGYDFDFINLDVEAANLQLFEALPLEKLTRTRMICVEHDNQIERMEALAFPYGYRIVHTNGENVILAR